MSDEWYYVSNGAKQGPVTAVELKRLTAADVIGRDTPIWKKGLREWVKAENAPGLFPSLPDEPPPVAGVQKGAFTGANPERLAAELRNNAILLFLIALLPVGTVVFGEKFIAIQAVLGLVLPVAWCVTMSIDLYRLWACVPNQHRITTPGRTVGFMFIPFFNFYWFLVVFRGLSACTNRALTEQGRSPSAPVGLATALAIATICFVVWPLGLMVALSRTFEVTYEAVYHGNSGLAIFLPLSLVLVSFVVLWYLWLIKQCEATFSMLNCESPAGKLKLWFYLSLASLGFTAVVTLVRFLL